MFASHTFGMMVLMDMGRTFDMVIKDAVRVKNRRSQEIRVRNGTGERFASYGKKQKLQV